MGAFGAHGLQEWLPKHFPDDAAKRLANWESAVRYQMYHALAIILVGVVTCQFPKLPIRLPACFFLIGITLFSGCLYGWVLTDIKPLVMIVPLGGVSLIVGWILFAISASRITLSSQP